MSTCSGLRLALFLETMFPAAEKRRSEGVDVAGTHKYDFARTAKEGNLVSFAFHHCRGSVLLGRGCVPPGAPVPAGEPIQRR